MSSSRQRSNEPAASTSSSSPTSPSISSTSPPISKSTNIKRSPSSTTPLTSLSPSPTVTPTLNTHAPDQLALPIPKRRKTRLRDQHQTILDYVILREAMTFDLVMARFTALGKMFSRDQHQLIKSLDLRGGNQEYDKIVSELVFTQSPDYLQLMELQSIHEPINDLIRNQAVYASLRIMRDIWTKKDQAAEIVYRPIYKSIYQSYLGFLQDRRITFKVTTAYGYPQIGIQSLTKLSIAKNTTQKPVKLHFVALDTDLLQVDRYNDAHVDPRLDAEGISGESLCLSNDPRRPNGLSILVGAARFINHHESNIHLDHIAQKDQSFGKAEEVVMRTTTLEWRHITSKNTSKKRQNTILPTELFWRYGKDFFPNSVVDSASVPTQSKHTANEQAV